jgi:hypothetical protein
MFVGVWTRPLFTFVYAFPALVSYRAAKIFSVVLSVATVWQTWRLAKHHGLDRSELTIPFLFFQPSFFLLAADTMTEIIFAFVFVVALRLHERGYVRLGALAASFMLLARPEGFFLGVMWGVWMLFDKRAGAKVWQRCAWSLLLATGAVVWVLSSWWITGDVLYIKHNWPSQWDATGAAYGRGTIFGYVMRLPEIAGPLLMIPFVFGLALLLKERKLPHVTSSFLTLFILHSVFWQFGLFGSAGYPRYFVCVAPAIAIIALAGWNGFAAKLSGQSNILRKGLAALVIIISAWLSFLYVDAAAWSRDARAVEDMAQWFRANPKPITKLVWSQAYMNIVLDRDPYEKPNFTGDRAKNLEILREMPKGTLVFWDLRTGPAFYAISADDIESAGFKRLNSKEYVLQGYVIQKPWFGYGGPREQAMYLFYKE